jgi:hypothetical protein
MSRSVDLTKEITHAKKQVKERRAAVESPRQDPALRGLRKALRRLQRRRRAVAVQQAQLKAKTTKSSGGEAAKAE